MKKHHETPLSGEELTKMQETLADMVRTEPEEKVRAYVDKIFPRLPKHMQEGIAASVFISSLRDETQELDTLSALQEEGIAALDQLEVMKTEAEQQEEA